MRILKKLSYLVILLLLLLSAVSSAANKLKIAFQVSMENPSLGTYQVVLTCSGLKTEYSDFKIPAWMPGYYQIMDYADDITDLSVIDAKGRLVKWEKANHNTWRIYNGDVSELIIKSKPKDHLWPPIIWLKIGVL